MARSSSGEMPSSRPCVPTDASQRRALGQAHTAPRAAAHLLALAKGWPAELLGLEGLGAAVTLCEVLVQLGLVQRDVGLARLVRAGGRATSRSGRP